MKEFKNANELRMLSLNKIAQYVVGLNEDSLEFITWYEEQLMPVLDEKYYGDCTTAENEEDFAKRCRTYEK